MSVRPQTLPHVEPESFARGNSMSAARRDALLGCLAIASGAIDAISFLALGKVFSAFMTGNIVFLGLRAGGGAGPDELRTVLALTLFSVGVAIAVRVAHREGDRLWPRRVTHALMVVAALEAAFTVIWVIVDGRPGAATADALVSISALAMGMQSGAVLALAVPGVFTTAATGTVVRLVGDLMGADPLPVQRRRLSAVLVGLFAGALAGAALVTHLRVGAAILPFTVTCAVVWLARRRAEVAADRTNVG